MNKHKVKITEYVKEVEERLNNDLSLPSIPINRKQRRAAKSIQRRNARAYSKILKQTLKD